MADTPLKTYTTCINCNKPFENCDPLLLPCLHSVCPPCFEKIREENSNACSFCFEIFSASLLMQSTTDHRRKLVPEFMKNKSEGFRFVLCNECEENNVSVKCTDCDRLLCDECLKSHDKFTKGHKKVNVDEMREMSFLETIAPLRCPIKCHKNLPLTRYCHTDQTVICDLCEITNHTVENDHRVENIETACLKKRQDLENIITKCQESIDVVVNQAANVQNETDQLIQLKELHENEINASINNIIEWIERRRRDLKASLSQKINNLEETFNHIFKSVTESKEALKETSLIAKYALEYVGPEDFCQIENLISNRHQILSERVGDICSGQMPNQERLLILPVKIIKLEELLSVNSWLSLIDYNLDIPDETKVGDSDEDIVKIGTLTINNNTWNESIKPFDIVVKNVENEEMPTQVTYDDMNQCFAISSKISCSGMYRLQMFLGRKQQEEKSVCVVIGAESTPQTKGVKNFTPKDRIDNMDHDKLFQLELQCPVCKEGFCFEEDRYPRLLPCLHVVGTNCLYKCMNDDHLKCPICEEIHELQNGNVDCLPRDYSRQNLAIYIKYKSDNNIVNCKEHDSTEALFCCQTCGEFVCDTCSNNSHIRKGHFLISLKDFDKNIPIPELHCNTLCDVTGHSNKHIEFYCTECSRLICPKCYLEQHYMHKVENYEVIYNKLHTKLMGMCTSLTEMKQTTNILDNAIDDKLDALYIAGNKELGKVRCTFNNHKLALEGRKQALERQVIGIRDMKKEVLIRQQQGLKNIEKKINESLNNASDFLSFSNKTAFISNFKFVERRVQNAIDMQLDTELAEQSLLLFLETKGTKRFENETENLGKIWPGNIYLPTLKYTAHPVTLSTECLLVSIQFKDKDDTVVSIKDIKQYIEAALLDDKGESIDRAITQLDVKEHGILEIKGSIHEPGTYKLMVNIANLSIRKEGFTINIDQAKDKQCVVTKADTIATETMDILKNQYNIGTEDANANHHSDRKVDKNFSAEDGCCVDREHFSETEDLIDKQHLVEKEDTAVKEHLAEKEKTDEKGHLREKIESVDIDEDEKGKLEETGPITKKADSADIEPLVVKTGIVHNDHLIEDEASETVDKEQVKNIPVTTDDNVTKEGLPKPPGVPKEPFEISSIGYTEVSLTWLPPDYNEGCPISSYVLEWLENEVEGWMKDEIPATVQPEKVSALANTSEEMTVEPMIEENVAQKLTYTVTGLADGATYLFRVRAKNEQGVSKPLLMKERISTNKFKDIPSTPIGPLRVENVTDSSVDLSWKHPVEALGGGAAITEYEVEYKLHKQPSWKRAGSVAGTMCTYQVTELLEGTEYSFRVTAYNEEGPSKPLKTDSATKTKAKLDLPDAPEHLETIKKGQNSVRLRWKKPKDFEGFECTGFIINKRHSATEEWQMIEKVPWHESSYVVSNLPYRDVYFSVAAENVAGIGRSIETKKPETLTYPRGRPSAPLGPLRAVDIDETELTLVWHPPEFDGYYEIDKYRLLKKDWPARHWNFMKNVTGQVNKFRVKGLTKGGKYAFCVEAVNKKGAGEPLETDSFVVTKALTVPLPPSGPLQYSDVTESSVKLIWNPPEDDNQCITDYFIEFHDTEDSVDYWDKCGIVPGYITEWTLTGLTPGHRYKFRIIAGNAKGLSEPLVCKELVHLDQTLQGMSVTYRTGSL